MVTQDFYTTRSPLCDSLKSSNAVAKEALDLEEDDLAEEGDDVLVFFLLAFLGPLGGQEEDSCAGLSGKLISVGSMDLAGSKSEEIKYYWSAPSKHGGNQWENCVVLCHY